jgi:probable F420-dependent oxidoreductase
VTTRYGIALPQVTGPGGADTDHLRRFVEQAERLGYAGLWVNELTSAPILDPLPLLSYVAAATDTVRLGVAVLLTPLRTPLRTARELATLDQLSGGRLIVGVGLGGSTSLYPPSGIPVEGRTRRFEDGVRLLELLWTDDKVTFESDWWQVQNLTVEPKPRQRPHPPIWFGARSEPALDRAVRLGDGWIGSGSAGPDEFRRHLNHIRRRLDAAGRDPLRFTLAKRVYVHVADEPGSGRDHVRRWFGANYGNPDLGDRVTIVGPPSECLEQIAAIADLGLDEILLNPVEDDLEQLEALAALLDPQPAQR